MSKMQKEKMFCPSALLKTFFLFSSFKKRLLEEELFFWWKNIKIKIKT